MNAAAMAHFNGSRVIKSRSEEGMVTEEKRKKTKIIPGTQSKARAGWPKRLSLIQATPCADFAVLDVQLCSTMTAFFSWVVNFAFNCYLRPRFWDCCQIFKMSDLFLLNAGLFPFSVSEISEISEILVSPSICTKIRTWRFHRT